MLKAARPDRPARHYNLGLFRSSAFCTGAIFMKLGRAPATSITVIDPLRSDTGFSHCAFEET